MIESGKESKKHADSLFDVCRPKDKKKMKGNWRVERKGKRKELSQSGQCVFCRYWLREVKHEGDGFRWTKSNEAAKERKRQNQELEPEACNNS